MKKNYFLLASLLLISVLNSDLAAQDNSKSTMEKFQEFKWKEPITKTSELVYEFTSEKDLKITFSAQIDKVTETYEEITLYYLSNTIDKTFDKNKVGKNQNGDYLIYKGRKGAPVTVKIVEFTPAGFKYENLKFKIMKTMYPVNK